MPQEIASWIIYFMFYSIIGYLAEVIFCSIYQKKLVGRGFLFGPYCPIYGAGSLLILFATSNIQDNVVLTFVVSAAVCSALEYLTSWLMEKLFHIRWWDYSKTDRINLHGRICLRNSIIFGIGGCFMVYRAHNFVRSVVNLFNINQQIFLAALSIAVLALDFLISLYATIKVKGALNLENLIGDQTNEIKRNCRKAVKQLVNKKRKK